MDNSKLAPSEAFLLGMVLEEYIQTREYAVAIDECRKHKGRFFERQLHERRFVDFLDFRLTSFFPKAYTVRYLKELDCAAPGNVVWHEFGESRVGVSDDRPGWIYIEEGAALKVELYVHFICHVVRLVRDVVAWCPMDEVDYPLDAGSWLKSWIGSRVAANDADSNRWLAHYTLSGKDEIDRINSRLSRLAEQQECSAEFMLGRQFGRLLGGYFDCERFLTELPSDSFGGA